MSESAKSAARALVEVIPRLSRVIAATLQAAPDLNLTVRQYRTLERLAERPHRTTELASASSVTQPTATSVIATLESRGLVRRTRDPEDGRATLIEITRDGEAICERAKALLFSRLVEITKHLDPEVQREIGEIAAALADAMDRSKEERASAEGNT